MVQVQELTPEVLLTEPRRGPAVANIGGTHAIYTVSTHELGDGTTHEFRILELKTGNSTRLSNDPRVHDVVWIPGSEFNILYLRSAEMGRTQIMVADARDPFERHYNAGEIDAPVSNLKLKKLDWQNVAFVVTGLVGDSGLYNQEALQVSSTAKVYDAEIPVWNASRRPHRRSLWYNQLVLRGRYWELDGKLFNLLPGMDLEVPSRLNSDKPCNDFDICRDGIAFSARDLRERGPDGRPPAAVYFAQISLFCAQRNGLPRQILIPSSFEPASITNVRFTPDRSSIGFLYTAIEDPYNTRLFLASLSSFDAFDVFSLVTCTDDEDLHPPRAFEFAGAESVILQSHLLGYETLSHLKLEDGAKPTVFFTGNSCSAFHPIVQDNWEYILTTSSSFIDSCLWQVVQVSKAKVLETISSATKGGCKFGLSKRWCPSFARTWLGITNGRRRHTNPAAWATKGYVVILPNFTGSSGYGLEFTRRIRDQRGDKPFQDLLSLIADLEDVPYLDKERATVVGNSSSAYLVNKLLGHDVAKKFCCAVYQNGAIDPPTPSPHKEHIFDNFDKLDPSYSHTDPEMIYENDMARSTFFHGWKNAPPTLIIHGEMDKQCSITDALSAFNSLQAQGVPSRLLTFPDEGHVVTKPENIMTWYKVVWKWLGKHVDGEEEEEEVDEELYHQWSPQPIRN
ncbi:hypothetical protein TrVFT333_001850 [Trichoderma virens FT-333]|nr:hypothetical protein TrVFT333_001850 [Trichoderma virens FT-333]